MNDDDTMDMLKFGHIIHARLLKLESINREQQKKIDQLLIEMEIMRFKAKRSAETLRTLY